VTFAKSDEAALAASSFFVEQSDWLLRRFTLNRHPGEGRDPSEKKTMDPGLRRDDEKENGGDEFPSSRPKENPAQA